MDVPEEIDDVVATQILLEGTLTIEGRLMAASNGTFFAESQLDGVSVACVYKPVRGERPLWDFPDGTLAGREVSAYLVASHLEWDCVPLTLWRDGGPMGEGMIQRWIDASEEETAIDIVSQGATPQGWREVIDAFGEDGRPVTLVHQDSVALQRLAVFDAIVNNADRKGGHILTADSDQRVFGIDHGLTFHEENKLRTVLWGWSGEPLPDDLHESLSALRTDLDGALGEQLEPLITRRELEATKRRVRRLHKFGIFPRPSQDWPALPWPVF